MPPRRITHPPAAPRCHAGVVAHDLVEITVDGRRQVAVCSCAWTAHTSTVGLAHAAWRFHVLQSTASSRRERAIEQCDSATRRRRQLSITRALIRTQRERIAAQRLNLRSGPSQMHGIDGARRARLLTAAREMLALPVLDLWLDYVAVGGARRAVDLAAMLDGSATIGRPDYERLAVVLNERFADSGLGRPVAHWSGD